MAAFKVNITKNGNAIKFQFTDSDHYLYGNGEIEVPVNSLSLVIDESDFVTFKKASTNDTFITFNPANSNLSDKAGVINFYKTNMVGSTGGGGSESGITSGEVQTMIDNSLEDYYTDDEVDAALSGKASVSDVTAVANDVSTLSGQVATKVATTDFNTYSAATDARLAEDEEVTAAALNDLDETKQDALEYYREDTSGKTATIHIEDAENGTQGEVVVDGASVNLYAQSNYEEEGSAIETHTDIWGNSDGIAMTYEKNIDDAEAAHCYFNVNEGLIAMEVMANEETTNVDVYSTGVTINGENVVTEDQLSGYQPILSAGTGIEISGNVISATGGGGATYSAGSGIAIDTANTISVSEPIHAFGHNVMIGESTYNPFKRNTVSSFGVGASHNFKNSIGRSVAFGASNTVNSDNCLAQGSYVTVNNIYEAGFGRRNNSVTGSTESGQTLFSVGNGTSSGNHNAFEIRQNGDIYFPDTDNTTYAQYYQKPMVRLQDMYAALGGLKFVQCTQAEYDALVSGGTVDSSTIYFITNVVS